MTHRILEAAEENMSAMRAREALALFDEAERCDADPDACAAGRWQCHMLLGEFEHAWAQSDLIERRGRLDPNRFWDGERVDGRRVLIRCLHGLGDTIQFIRYVPLVRARAKSVIIEAQPKLKILLEDSALADHVMTWSEPEPEWDQQIEVIELPRMFRSTIATIPGNVPYLRARACELPRRRGDVLKVGVAWCSSAFNPARSMPITDLAPVFDVPGVAFYALQSGPEHEDIGAWRDGVVDLYEQVSTIHDTASVLRALDLVITVDTMTAHLAGALAVPVWTLLPYECDWRWMIDREDSPWYPTMRLFRQPQPGNWVQVVANVEHNLRALAARAKISVNGSEERSSTALLQER
jgi:hypothetical protein